MLFRFVGANPSMKSSAGGNSPHWSDGNASFEALLSKAPQDEGFSYCHQQTPSW
jgi:hypothetical protein